MYVLLFYSLYTLHPSIFPFGIIPFGIIRTIRTNMSSNQNNNVPTACQYCNNNNIEEYTIILQQQRVQIRQMVFCLDCTQTYTCRRNNNSNTQRARVITQTLLRPQLDLLDFTSNNGQEFGTYQIYTNRLPHPYNRNRTG